MHPDLRRLALCLMAILPATAAAAWQLISAEPGRRVEIDKASIRKVDRGKTEAHGRIVLDKPIVDPRTSSSYRIVEAVNHYDCASRNYSTLKRSYFKDEGELLREEEVKVPIEMPVRSGMLDDKLLREACRPKAGNDAALAARQTAEKVSEAAGELRKANEALVRKDVKRANLRTLAAEKSAAEATPASVNEPLANAHAASPPTLLAARTRRAAARSSAPSSEPDELAAAYAHANIHWSYEGEGRPENWGRLRAEFATCASGERQSPIDIRDGFGVDLEAIQFTYRRSEFRVIDNGHTVQVEVGGSNLSLLGKTYDLIQFHFHRPSEERINGQSFDMVIHLVHKAEDGQLAVVAVLLEQGAENPIIQAVWNNLPLEKNDYVAPPGQAIDLAQLLPEERSYYTYMGSLTTPPCTEDVLWLVLKKPQQISLEQLKIFARLYPHNARPVQPRFSRMIKESR
ncbi:carbonic anhydrase family protein [Candidatus Accumulibacter sp. ACC003]|uniref:carbonic anhydrase n=1 Tax=Candidatus Accumulibacter sp. ACC003 TaxID=2823334 RepID=UPI0025C61E63|nr:carbonic anhydrase family protein [Candidatus Accumulibacter sp. ACC003]